MNHCLRCKVSGRVQGVWFRASTQQLAVQLGVTGSATNMPDGSVEVVACGENSAVETLKQWLWQGPELAAVTDVSCEGMEPHEIPRSFTTG